MLRVSSGLRWKGQLVAAAGRLHEERAAGARPEQHLQPPVAGVQLQRIRHGPGLPAHLHQ